MQPILRVDTLLKTQPSQLIRSWQYQNRLSRHESLSAFETGLTRHTFCSTPVHASIPIRVQERTRSMRRPH